MPETMEYRISKLEERVKENEDRNSTTHEKFYAMFNELHEAQAVTNERYANILATIQQVLSDLTYLKEKPTKKWDNLSSTIVACVVTAIVTGIVSLLVK